MDEVQQFLERYQAQAGLHPHKQYADPRPPRLSDWQDLAQDYITHIRFERKPYVEMLIPQHRFQELVERDRHYTEMSRHNDYATSVVNQMVADEVVRKTNPTVEQAWRRYQMLLELARS